MDDAYGCDDPLRGVAFAETTIESDVAPRVSDPIHALGAQLNAPRSYSNEIRTITPNHLREPASHVVLPVFQADSTQHTRTLGGSDCVSSSSWATRPDVRACVRVATKLINFVQCVCVRVRVDSVINGGDWALRERASE